MADSTAYQAEKQLKDLGDKVPSQDKTRAEGLIKDLRQAIEKENSDPRSGSELRSVAMKSLTNDLQQALMEIGSAVYSQGSASTNGGQNNARSSSNGSSDHVIDADFVESK